MYPLSDLNSPISETQLKFTPINELALLVKRCKEAISKLEDIFIRIYWEMFKGSKVCRFEYLDPHLTNSPRHICIPHIQLPEFILYLSNWQNNN
jgi:hypothetical protein